MFKRNADGSFEIDVISMFKALWNRIWVIIFAAAIFGLGGFLYANYYLTPRYQASALMYVNNRGIDTGSNLKISTGEINAAKSLVNTYLVILTSRTCLNEVIARGGYNLSYTSLKGMISTEAVEETEIFKITVTTTDATLSASIANTIADVLPDKISDIVDGSSVRVVDYAVVMPGRTYPSRMKYVALGLGIGVAFSVVAILVLEALDDLIHDEDYLKSCYSDVAILATIPDLSSGRSDGYGYSYKKGSYNYGYGYGSSYGRKPEKENKEETK